jgi:hypothetical protein
MNVYCARVALPAQLDEIEDMIAEYGETDLEFLRKGGNHNWAMPPSCSTGDVVLFQLGMKAPARLRGLIRQATKAGDTKLTKRLNALVEPVNNGAGSLIACARIGAPPYTGESGSRHYIARTYADIVDVTPFAKPLRVVGTPLAAFPVFAPHGRVAHRMFSSQHDYEKTCQELRALGNPLPHWTRRRLTDFRGLSPNKCVALARAPGTSFVNEAQFCLHLAEPLCQALSDDGSFRREVPVRKMRQPSAPTKYVDFVIPIDRALVPVEAKLSVTAEPNLIKQVRAYTGPLRVSAGEHIRHRAVVVVDQYGVYLFVKAKRVGNRRSPDLKRTDLNARSIRALRHRISALVVQSTV